MTMLPTSTGLSTVTVRYESEETLARKAIEMFLSRMTHRGGLAIASADTSPSGRLTVTIDHSAATEPPESYQLCITRSESGVEVSLSAADAHGVLYGLGRLLRVIEFHNDDLYVPELSERQAPAIADRGVYFATHFKNFYECAPLDAVTTYIEELALWGVNVLGVWFDMNWFPYGCWENERSDGARMIERLRAITATARACGMRVAMIGLANEGFSFQPPVEMRANLAGRRGGFYPESQICPSYPGGLELIKENRRRVLSLLPDFDLFVCWPYDQGGCGCTQCGDEQHRWGGTFLRISAEIAAIVHEANPRAGFILSTWLFDNVELELVHRLCDENPAWLDGVLLDTHHVDDMPLPSRYSRWVFPEISMFDTYFTSYGCNGANPAPERFYAEAQDTVRGGCGTQLYSEGMYDDLNKWIWMAVLWNPSRSLRELVEEYCGYYFGADLRAEMTDLLLALEQTWGARKLMAACQETTEDIFTRLQRVDELLPADAGCRDRWLMLRGRAEMDALMKRIGPDDTLAHMSRLLYEEGCCTEDLPQYHHRLADFASRLHAREALVEALFMAHWHYLQSFNLQRTTLAFTPDAVLGKRNWQPLRQSLDAALALPVDETFRLSAIRAFKRWFWLNGIDIGYLFL